MLVQPREATFKYAAHAAQTFTAGKKNWKNVIILWNVNQRKKVQVTQCSQERIIRWEPGNNTHQSPSVRRKIPSNYLISQNCDIITMSHIRRCDFFCSTTETLSVQINFLAESAILPFGSLMSNAENYTANNWKMPEFVKNYPANNWKMAGFLQN